MEKTELKFDWRFNGFFRSCLPKGVNEIADRSSERTSLSYFFQILS